MSCQRGAERIACKVVDSYWQLNTLNTEKATQDTLLRGENTNESLHGQVMRGNQGQHCVLQASGYRRQPETAPI